jgi:hypothetical protein
MAALELGALCLAAIAGGAWLVGSLLLPAGLCRGRVEQVALAGVLGLLVVGQLDFLLRACGWRLAPAALGALLAVALGVALRRRRRAVAAPPITVAAPPTTAAPPATSPPAPPATLPVAAAPPAASRPRAPLVRLALLLAAGGAPLLLLALYPPIDPDPGIYHLPFARAFAASGGLPFLASLRFPVFPQLSELLFAFGLRLDGTTGAHLVETVMALATALLLWLWGRDAGGEVAGLVGAALWLGNPMVIFLATTAHVDVGLACLVAAGLYCLERARTGERAAWPVLAGAFLGGAAAVKYLGLFYLAAGAAAMLVRPRRRFAPRFALAALAVALPVYAHILRLTGNPVFPFLPQVFGYTEWTHDLALRPEQVRPIPVPWTAATAAALVRFPAERAAAMLRGGAAKLDLLMQADRDPPHIRALRRLPGWGRAGVLLAVAATWLWALGRPPLRLAVGVALASLLPGLATLEDMGRLDPRYILAAGPPLALATAAAIAAIIALAAGTGRPLPALAGHAWPRAAALGKPALAALAVLAGLAPGMAYAAVRCRFLGPLPLDAAARAAVEGQHLPGLAALREVGRRHGSASTVYGLDLENLTFYAPGRYLGSLFGPARYARLAPAFAAGDDLFAALRRLGADHLLAPRARLAALPRDAGFAAHFRLEHEDAEAVVWELQPLAAGLPGAPGEPGDPGTHLPARQAG